MCHSATGRKVLAAAMSLCIVAPAYAQTPMEWRRIGNSAFEAGLAGIATGPVSRVWFSPDGGTLYAQTRSGKLWQTNDFQAWQPAATSASNSARTSGTSASVTAQRSLYTAPGNSRPLNV